MKVLVIGGGPAGMMAAISAAQQGNAVTLLEKMNTVGKKLLITGKGRCNITSNLPMEDFIKNIPGNGMFLYSAFHHFTNIDIINFLKEEGLTTKVERGERIFPTSDKSIEVKNAFLNKLKKLKIIVKTNAKVEKILVENGHVKGLQYQDSETRLEETIMADKVILATGGKSYSSTGSTGDGYLLAKGLGHTVSIIKPSLVPLEVKEIMLCKALQGLSLKNVSIKIVDSTKKKEIYQDFGEMLFTHFGISGPTILSGSAHLVRYKEIDTVLKQGNICLKIDLKPALSVEKLDARLIRDLEQSNNKQFKNSLEEVLPQKLIPIIIELSQINPNKKANEISKEERKHLVQLLKEFTITISGFRPIEEAIVTAGGINVKEINPKTMESKLVEGLFFAGEVIDVDGYTGGFNLQIAYSTGYTAGLN